MSDSPRSDIAAAKAALRQAARRRRAELSAAAGADTFRRAARLFLDHVPRRPDDVVALYWPLPTEFDPLPLLEALTARGHACALPAVTGPGAALAFRAWRPGAALHPGPFGLREPGPDAAEAVPDIVVLPCLAFDRAGYRLGYGAGYYDRSLAARRAAGARPATCVLLAYAGQEIARVPTDPHDQKADWIITEDYAIPTGTHL